MRSVAVSATLIAAAAVIAYSGIYKNDFVHYDDDVYITDNTHVRQGLSREAAAWAKRPLPPTGNR